MEEEIGGGKGSIRKRKKANGAFRWGQENHSSLRLNLDGASNSAFVSPLQVRDISFHSPLS